MSDGWDLIHQPLHVGVGYFSFAPDDTVALHRDPLSAAANKGGNDEGGNKLVKGSTKLHAYWDSGIPRMIAADAAKLADEIKSNLDKVSDTVSGANTTWASQWATATAKLSNSSAYDDMLSFGKRIESTPRRMVHLRHLALGLWKQT